MIDTDVVKTVSADMPRGAGERILFVDDEMRVAEVGKEVLNFLGYRADTCASAELAIELMLAAPDAYALVISDHMMPGMKGTELAQRLKAMRPGLPIILMTGDTDGIQNVRLRAMGVRQLLAKPLLMQSLAFAVRRELPPPASLRLADSPEPTPKTISRRAILKFRPLAKLISGNPALVDLSSFGLPCPSPPIENSEEPHIFSG